MTDRPAILVPGGAGYIGSHTAKALSEAGFLPVVYDNLSLGHRDFVRFGPLVEGDIADSARVAETCRAYAIKAAVHFAAYSLVGESVTDPGKYYRNNVGGTLGLLEGMRACGADTLVFSSTCATYGQPGTVPIAEDTPQNPINAYGASKLMAERMIRDFGLAHGLKWMALRYFNACGADASGLLGEKRDPETHLIPRALMSLLGYIPDFAVFGTDYPTPDGTAVRDYIHVGDLARAHVLALGHLLQGGTSGAVNLGSGAGYSVREILAAVERVTGHRLSVGDGPRRAGDPPSLVADPSRAASVLGFRTEISDLDTIVGSAWAWHQRAHPKLNAPAR